MSAVHEQTLVDAPISTVWDLVGNPTRYPEWFPRVFEVNGERFEEGADLIMATRQPIIGRDDIPMHIDRLDGLREIRMHCSVSGMFVHWQLTDAQGGTFLDAEFGMDPMRTRDQIIDFTVGRRFFRRWLSEAVDGLKEAATHPASV
jgi:Polyketide cyclase / dehydrase and lipid transport